MHDRRGYPRAQGQANTGHVPRHAKSYRNFAAEYARLQNERIAAFREFAAGVTSGAYLEFQHGVSAGPELASEFTEWLDGQ